MSLKTLEVNRMEKKSTATKKDNKKIVDDCIFCKLIAGKLPCTKLYEDDKTFAILDISPVNKGHALVMPKQHFENTMSTPEETLNAVTATVRKVASALKKSLKADGINISSNNGSAAGQVVMHTHIHIIPRFAGDGLKTWPHTKYEEGEMEKYRKNIATFLK